MSQITYHPAPSLVNWTRDEAAHQGLPMGNLVDHERSQVR